jgi:hypothetical protein
VASNAKPNISGKQLTISGKQIKMTLLNQWQANQNDIVHQWQANHNDIVEPQKQQTSKTLFRGPRLVV